MLNQLSLLFILNLMSAVGYSLLAPLYPSLAAKRNINDFTIGIIFSTFAFSNVGAISIAPKLINIFGRRYLLYTGIAIEVRII
jgi:MFS family permease